MALTDGMPRLRFDDAGMTYPNGTHALEHISLDITGGRVVGLLGENGAGKSTLIHLAAGVLRPTTGAVAHTGGRIGWCAQRQMIDWFVSTRTNVWLGARLAGLSGKAAWERADEAIRQVGLDDVPVNDTPEALSGGQQQRLMIARVLAMRPPIMLLDEPTVGLDLVNLDRLLDALDKARGAGALVIVSSHDFQAVEHLIDDVVLLDHGHMAFQGGRDEFIRRYAQEETITITLNEAVDSALVASLGSDAQANDDERTITLRRAIGSPIGPILARLEGAGLDVLDCARKPATLEDAMRRITTTTNGKDRR